MSEQRSSTGRRFHPETFGDEVGFLSPDFVPHPDDDDHTCTFGGMGCQYWIRESGCPYAHWERHYVQADGTCACGNEYPGASNCIAEFDASEEE